MKLDVQSFSKMCNLNIFSHMCNLELIVNFETDKFHRNCEQQCKLIGVPRLLCSVSFS